MGTVRRVTDAQVKELRRLLRQGASLKKAARKADMDRKSGRKYQEGPLPSERREPRKWRTRPDPLAGVWPELEEMLRREPGLQAVTLLGWLEGAYPGQYGAAVRRTLERRVRSWKAKHGPAKEVYFAQEHEPGRLGASDFTHMSSLGVTIAGEPFAHLVYHFVLTHSNWEHISVCFSESFASLSEGLQNALWALGGAPLRHRTDRMTLAVNADGQAEEFTARYAALLSHYGLHGEATNPASGHENGDCEQSHRRFKEGVEQALLLRGSRDFASRQEYEGFLRALLAKRNAARQAALDQELPRLRALPAARLETQERRRVRVHRGSTIHLQHNIYSVPARLIGEHVEARIGAEEIEVWYGDMLVQRMPRLRGQNKRLIDYRHVIGWLVRKPGAFARYVFRAELYPTTTFRRAYDSLVSQSAERADRHYVQLLHLASEEGEAAVEAALEQLLNAAAPLSVHAVRALWGQATPADVVAQVAVAAVDLGQYDALLNAPEAMTEAMAEAVLEASAPAEQSPIDERFKEEEVKDEAERGRGSDAVSGGAALADDAHAVRGGGAAGDGGDVELRGVSAGAGAAGMRAAARAAHRASAQDVEAAAGEELGGAGPEAVAGEGGAAVAWPVERRLSGPARERADVRTAGLGQDALPGGGGAGVGAGGAAGVVHDVRPAGAGTAGGQARLRAEGLAQASGSLGGVAGGRPGLRAAQPGGDGGVVHVVGGAIRAGQRAGDEQPAVLEVGADLQGPDDDGGGGGSASAPQRAGGAEHPELPGGGGQASQAGGSSGRFGMSGAVSGPAVSGWGILPPALGRSGSAAFACAALRLTPLRQPAPTPGLPRGER
jgi:hypothetical protein